MSLRAKCLGHPRITVVEANASALICDDETNGKGVAAVSTSTTTTDDHVRGVLATVKSTTPPSAMETAFTAPLTFLVDGCFSKFRKEIPHKDVLVRSHFAGVVLEDCPLPMPNHGHVVLADPSPILLYQVGYDMGIC